MTKLRIVAALIIALVSLATVSIAAVAEEVPSPYAGLKNPFPWEDSGAQQAGKKVYQQSCLGCHGIKGESLAGSNFSAASYADSLQKQPARAFWLLTEGRLDRGMPPFKSTLSEEQRWQVINYMWLLGKQAPPATAPATKPAADLKASLMINAPKEAQSGRTISLIANLRDDQGKPVANATVQFFVQASFFSQGLMDIGDAVTDSEGVATLVTALRDSGDVQVVARYATTEAATTLTMTGGDRVFYRTRVGIRMPTLGSEVMAGPVITESLDDMGRAPASILRLPGGTLSWLLLLVLAVLGIWSTYFFVVYQVLHISASAGRVSRHSRTFPYTILIAVAVIGIVLALKLLTGPYSQFHLFP